MRRSRAQRDHREPGWAPSWSGSLLFSKQTRAAARACSAHITTSGVIHALTAMPMEEFIHQQNLGRYRKMLSEKTHEPQRQTILRLLADEETRDEVPELL
jgi:hypothetical protein